jgi:hypothetical protein
MSLKEDTGKCLLDLFEDQPDETILNPSHEVHLTGYGYRWFRVGNPLI